MAEFKGISVVHGCRQNESSSNEQDTIPKINILWIKSLRVCKKQIDH